MIAPRAAALGLVLAAAACSRGAGDASSSERVRVAPALLRAMDRQERAPVLVTTTSVAQARALARWLEPRRRFERVPALAAEVTRAELEALRRAPGVRVIALDEGGVGHLSEALPLAGFSAIEGAGLTGADVVVAVIDSGIDRAHPDLQGAVLDEACFCSSGCCPGGATEAFGEGSAADDNGHGTHVAGIIAGRGTGMGAGTGRAGGAPGVLVIAIKILDAHNAFCCTSDLVAALDWLMTHHPEVGIVNMSFGANGLFQGDCDDRIELAPVAAAANALIDGGAVLVASSGNHGDAHAMSAPACLAGVISAGAVWDEDLGPEGILCAEPVTYPDLIACFSNASSTLDVLAPGAIVTSTWPGGQTRGRAGTSQAAPMVSACAASLLEAAPTATPAEISAALRSSPVRLTDARNGRTYPRLDCGAALRALEGEDGGALDAGDALDAGEPFPFDAGDTGDAGDAEPHEAGASDAADPHEAGAGDAAEPHEAGASDAAEPHEAGVAPDAASVPDADAASAGGDAELDAMSEGEEDARAEDVGERGPTPAAASDCACRSAGARRAALPSSWAAWLALTLAGARLGRRRGL